MKEIKKIASFQVDHRYITPGLYISRIDDDVTTYDLRTRKPNCNDYMDHSTMHTLEHMFATYVRSSEIGDSILYFGPMGCQTGFYLLVRNADHNLVRQVIISTLENIMMHTEDVFGNSEIECGNFSSLCLDAAKKECAQYLNALQKDNNQFIYPKED